MQERKKGGRPVLLSEKRKHVIKAKLTDAEILILKELEREAYMNRAELIRTCLLGGKVVTTHSLDLLKSLDPIGIELGRAGNNINQLARHVNMLNRQNKLDTAIVISFNSLLADYTQKQTELEKTLRQILRNLRHR
ncbi:MobC family plasmid mobilization relaxosome protein [Sphingobacterium sp. SGL-16]|uniref:MobC family plasmid mobilization relaxosome protein n=1 Tax=Sphingobacterium sp. SGL-16 TaxID=2710883 RepID=UPI0013EC170C|nr:MobC family plasmid mobilization relaxosome protein [Sphingobacterium sp. SGL-16]NGM71640.1 MobC family plasmid mobilization relaxosome protein [Sphingobacterium sp. SGL-16]